MNLTLFDSQFAIRGRKLHCTDGENQCAVKNYLQLSAFFHDDFCVRRLHVISTSHVNIVSANFSSDGKTTGDRKLDKKLQFYESKHMISVNF